MSIMDRLIKTSKIDEVELLSKSNFMDKTETPTPIPMINVALSGSMDGGLKSGMTVLAGPSKHFKTTFALLMLKSYLDTHKDAICLFYDSEFGASDDYFESFDIDTSRVIHSPIKNVEELKFDIVNQLEEIKRTDNVFILIDSIGNLASKKEIQDAKDENSVADMTRAKQIKSLFRITTPYLTMLDIPMVAVAHTYDTQEKFSKKVVSGGTGITYSADTVWVIGRSQNKEGKDVIGYDFNINIEKGRYVQEKSKIPISVSFEGGMNKYSGMLDLAVEMGYVLKPKVGWYTRVLPDKDGVVKEDKNWRAKETSVEEFWKPILEETDFKEAVERKYKIANIKMIEVEPSTPKNEVEESKVSKKEKGKKS